MRSAFASLYTLRERGSGGYTETRITLSVRPSVCLSVRMSVLIRVRPITFFWFDIGLPYLVHGCITMRRCVAHIDNPDSALTFDLKVKFKGFLACFRVRPKTFYAPLEKGGILFCNCRSVGRYDGLSVCRRSVVRSISFDSFT